MANFPSTLCGDPVHVCVCLCVCIQLKRQTEPVSPPGTAVRALGQCTEEAETGEPLVLHQAPTKGTPIGSTPPTPHPASSQLCIFAAGGGSEMGL